MKKYNSIQDIRDAIDKIDLEIIDLISDRKDLVDEVVKLKKKDQIVDQERIDFILNWRYILVKKPKNIIAHVNKNGKSNLR